MQIVQTQLNDKQRWDDFVSRQKMGGLTQSWDWGEVFSKTPSRSKNIYRYFVVDNDKIRAAIFVTQSPSRFGFCNLYAPRGPVLVDDLTDEEVKKVLKVIAEEIKKIAKRERVTHFSFELFTTDQKYLPLIKIIPVKAAPRNIQPKDTLILNLEKNADELFNQMHQKTRYNIRLAQKKGVTIKIDNSKLDDFFSLLQKTQARHEVHFFPKKYFEEILKFPWAKLYLAYYQNKPIAANLVTFWGTTVSYLFGGTDYEYRPMMAPQLLQWQAILDAKNQGFKYYDFWGAAAKGSAEEKKWAGVTRFKLGFAPNQPFTQYLGTFEVVYKPWVLKLYRFLQRF